MNSETMAFQLDTSEQGYSAPFLAGWVWVVSKPDPWKIWKSGSGR